MVYEIEFSEDEHRFVEKQIDRLRSDNLSVFNQIVMDGQFRAGGNKLLSESDNDLIKSSFRVLLSENLRVEDLLKRLQEKFEDGYSTPKSSKLNLSYDSLPWLEDQLVNDFVDEFVSDDLRDDAKDKLSSMFKRFENA